MTLSDSLTPAVDEEAEPGPPFYVTQVEARRLRAAAEHLEPALVIEQATSFDEYVRQLMIPPRVMDLARKASQIRLASWEVQGIRESLEPGGGGLLRRILEDKALGDPTHPPYIRVSCTGKGDYDHLAADHGLTLGDHRGDFGSPAVLEIWPAQHYSPMHSHGGTTGIIHCLTGLVDVMAYDRLDWGARKLALLTLTPGQCAWLAGDQFAVHRVFCPLDGGALPVVPPNLVNDSSDFGATFHVYLNEDEATSDVYEPAQLGSREVFEYVDEISHQKRDFKTYSDLSWHVLRKLLADYADRTSAVLPA